MCIIFFNCLLCRQLKHLEVESPGKIKQYATVELSKHFFVWTSQPAHLSTNGVSLRVFGKPVWKHCQFHAASSAVIIHFTFKKQLNMCFCHFLLLNPAFRIQWKRLYSARVFTVVMAAFQQCFMELWKWITGLEHYQTAKVTSFQQTRLHCIITVLKCFEISLVHCWGVGGNDLFEPLNHANAMI